MSPTNIQDAIKHAKPFTLKMDNGEKIVIKHPDFILLTPNKRTALVVHDDNHFDIIDIDHVSSISTKIR